MKISYYKFIIFFIILLILWKMYYFLISLGDKYSNTLLYPQIKPLNTYYIDVSSIHTVVVSIYGNIRGKPILFIHGGPGAGTTEISARFFDPSYYFIIIVDQRGSGKSTPSSELKENTTQHLVEDFEVIRKKLSIEKWILFGGSWGSTLSLVYAIKYPNVISGMILRGIFLCNPQEIEWVYGINSGTKFINPIAWNYFVNTLPNKDLTGNYIVDYKNCFDGKFGEKNKDKCLLSWSVYEANLSKLKIKDLEDTINSVKETNYSQPSSIGIHYVINNCFLEPGFFFNKENINKIKHIPTIIVQGRYDLVCPPITAYKLHEMLPNSQLHITLAGHSPLDEENLNKLVEATNSFKNL